MINRGNEAKKWLKTKDITFSDGADYVYFACKLALIGPRNEQKQQDLLKTNRSPQAREGAKQGQIVGYTGARLTWSWHSLQGLRFQAVGFWRECRFNPCGLSCRIGKALAPSPLPPGGRGVSVNRRTG